MTEAIREFVKINAGKIRLVKDAFDSEKIVTDALNVIPELTKCYGVKVFKECDAFYAEDASGAIEEIQLAKHFFAEKAETLNALKAMGIT